MIDGIIFNRERIITIGKIELKIWDEHTRENIKTIEAHTTDILSMAISPDGDKLVTGGKDKSLKMWDLQTGELEA